jgi:hypothetical protein
MMIHCVCGPCGAEWDVENFTDPGPDGHAYGQRCPHPPTEGWVVVEPYPDNKWVYDGTTWVKDAPDSAD